MFFPKSFTFFRIFSVLLFVIVTGCAQLPNLNPLPGSSSTASTSNESPRPSVTDGYVEPLPNLGPKGYLVKPIARDVYFFTNGYHNTMFVVSSEGVLLVDPLQGAGELIKRAIREVTDQKVVYLVYTHHHRDHIGDAYRFQDGARIIAHQGTLEILSRYHDSNRPLPHISFRKNYILNLGGKKIDLIHPGAGHTFGNIFVHLPDDKILMLVDVASPKTVPDKHFNTVDLYGQVLGLQKASRMKFDTFVGGHFHRPGTHAELKEILKYYHSAKRANRQAVKEVDSNRVLGASPHRDPQHRIQDYFDAVSDACYRRLKSQWSGKLMGFSANGRSHCEAWTRFHLEDKLTQLKR